MAAVRMGPFEAAEADPNVASFFLKVSAMARSVGANPKSMLLRSEAGEIGSGGLR